MIEQIKTYLTAIKYGLMAAVLALLLYADWYVASSHYKKLILEKEQSQLKSTADAQAKQLEMTKIAGERHAKDQLVINRLSSELGGLRIHVPQSGTCKGSNGDSGLAAARIEEYLADAKQQIDAIGQRCAQLNLDAIQSNESKN